MNATGQNAFPNVNFDFGVINNLFNRFFAAGFYYKTFMGIPPFEWGKGTKAWMFYEKFIRKAAGMGSASRKPDPDKYEHVHAHCDLLVVGAGPSGLTAALKAVEYDLDVIIVEQDCELGGTSLSEQNSKIKEQILKIKESSIKIMKRTTAFGLYDCGVAGLLELSLIHI